MRVCRNGHTTDLGPCPDCRKIRRKRYYAKHRTVIRATNTAYYKANTQNIRKQRSDYRKGHKDDIAKRVITYVRANLHKIMFRNAKMRALKKGLDFTITLDDIVIPDLCPVLGIRLESKVGKDKKRGASHNSPTLDRINPNLGYVLGNVQCISWRANKLKSDATLQELRLLVAWLETNA